MQTSRPSLATLRKASKAAAECWHCTCTLSSSSTTKVNRAPWVSLSSLFEHTIFRQGALSVCAPVPTTYRLAPAA